MIGIAIAVIGLKCAPLVAADGPISISPTSKPTGEVDPFAWLEAIDDPRSLEWVMTQNEMTARRLAAWPDYEKLYRDALAVLDSPSRLPDVRLAGKYLYNLWQDPTHPRGIYRRTTLEQFRHENPEWETVLDVDALSAAEGKAWAFGGMTWLTPDHRRGLVRLSLGGGDAFELREFDADKKEFVAGGFVAPAAKSRVDWRDADSLYIATDFGAGSLTKSGYPRIVKVWRRGTPLSAAAALFEGEPTSIAVSAHRFQTKSGEIDLLTHAVTFWTTRSFQIVDEKLLPIPLPDTAQIIGGFDGRLVVWLKEDWMNEGEAHVAGTVLLVAPPHYRGAAAKPEVIVAPTKNEVVKQVEVTRDVLLVAMLNDVKGRLFRYAPGAQGWTRNAIVFDDHAAIAILTTEDQTGDALVQHESFTSPPAIYLVKAQETTPVAVKTQAPAFDGERFDTHQYWTQSADGTRLPYFVVAAKGIKRDGTSPTWMFSYGGFEVSLTPAYSGSYEALRGAYGKLWLERGGVFVLANIRGGGEFGPAWHQAALKENHFKAFEDFEAVARDLVARKITSPAHLGIEGRSNGGLLVGSTMLRHPELYGAVICGNPLLDMQRYHRLSAGASWMAEYGDPDDPTQWAYISRYSPYQNLQPGMKLPPVMFYTSTRDDRVHPGHARKMAAKMETLGYSVDYFETMEGGHHGSVTNEQLATRLARTYAFLWSHLK